MSIFRRFESRGQRGRGSVVAVVPAAAVDKPIFDLQPFAWFRADTVTLNTGNVATIPNRVGTDALVMAGGTLVAPVVDSSFAGAPSISFTGTQYLDSNLPASSWIFLHDGTGMEVFHVYAPTLAATGIIASNMSSALFGFQSAIYQDGHSEGSIRNPTSNTVALLTSAVGAHVANIPTYMEFSHKSAAAVKSVMFVKESVVGSTTIDTNAPSATAAYTLCLGTRADRAVPAQMKWVDTIIFKRTLTEYERQQVREYIQNRYGIAAPVLTTEERTVLSLNPFSWSRADKYTTAGANVASFLDKGLPGHSLVQATPANQVAIPTADSLFTNKPSATFAGSQWYTSNLLPASWKFTQDGSGCEILTVFTPTTLTPLGAFWCTLTDTGVRPGAQNYYNIAGAVVAQVDVTPAAVTGTTSNALTANVANYVDWIWKNADPMKFQTLIGAVSGIVNFNASTPDPGAVFPLVLGASTNGASPGRIRWCEILIFNRKLTEYERQLVREYIQARYGIPAPIVSDLDKTILKLNPFSWVRPDSTTAVGGKVTAFIDKARPGHSYTQGNAALQVAVPTASAVFNGQPVCTFSAHRYESNLLPAAWTFNHDGTGRTNFCLLKSNSTAAPQTAYGTNNSLRGTNFYYVAQVGSITVSTTDGTQNIAPAAVPYTTSLTVPTLFREGYKEGSSPEFYLRTATGVIWSGDSSAPPTTAAPTNAMSLGDVNGGTLAASADFAEWLFFNRVLTPDEVAIVLNYYKVRYGVDGT